MARRTRLGSAGLYARGDAPSAHEYFGHTHRDRPVFFLPYGDHRVEALKATTMYDLAVVGGGPAGTSAAITAAGYGATVLLLEKGSFPRSKVCGEFVSAEALALLASLLGSRDLVARAPRLGRA